MKRAEKTKAETSIAPISSLLLDTNVWIDNYLGTRAGSKEALRLISEADDRGIALLYPMVTVKDTYYLLCQEFKKQAPDRLPVSMAAAEEAAWACIQNMRAIATAVGADETDLWEAEMHHRVHRDLEDNLIVAAAKRAHASYLVTRDERLLAKAAVPCVSPADMLALLGA